MLINGWDISDAHAKQHKIEYGNHSIKNNSEWIAGSPAVAFVNSTIGFKEIEVQLILKESKKEAVSDISMIMSHLLEPAELILDGNDHRFFGVLTKQSTKEVVQERWYNLTLTFECYEYADEVVQSFSGQTEMLVSNKGNILTPVIVEVTPRIGTALIVLTGLCRNTTTGDDLPIRISNLETGKKVIIDGETGLVTQDGELKSGDAEFWDIPTLLPGENKITVDNNRMDIALRFHPRFM